MISEESDFGRRVQSKSRSLKEIEELCQERNNQCDSVSPTQAPSKITG
jgi:hypothetical protein